MSRATIEEVVTGFRDWYTWWCDLEGDCPISPPDLCDRALTLLNGTELEGKVAHAIAEFFIWLSPSLTGVDANGAEVCKNYLLQLYREDNNGTGV